MERCESHFANDNKYSRDHVCTHDQDHIGRHICICGFWWRPLLMIPQIELKRAVPNANCDGRVYSDVERADILRYMTTAAMLQRDFSEGFETTGDEGG